MVYLHASLVPLSGAMAVGGGEDYALIFGFGDSVGLFLGDEEYALCSPRDGRSYFECSLVTRLLFSSVTTLF